jgi:uncharacterized protein (TIGR00369 family)
VSRDVTHFADNMMWRVMGFRLLSWGEGRADVGWEAPQSCATPMQGGAIVRGGMVTAVLDAAMGAACWSVLDASQAFVTADMRAEFLHPCRPGEFVATGVVRRRKRDVVQCSAELRSPDGLVCVTSSCTQVVVLGEDAHSRGPGAPPPIVRG